MWNDIVQQVILPAVGILASGVAVWAVTLFQRKTGIELEAAHRDALQTALTNAAGLLLNKAVPSVTTTAAAANYVLDAAPDALRHFGLSFKDVQQKVEAKVGQLAAPSPPAP